MCRIKPIGRVCRRVFFTSSSMSIYLLFFIDSFNLNIFNAVNVFEFLCLSSICRYCHSNAWSCSWCCSYRETCCTFSRYLRASPFKHYFITPSKLSSLARCFLLKNYLLLFPLWPLIIVRGLFFCWDSID